jgi:cytochrome c oxidase assembly protein subunit 15
VLRRYRSLTVSPARLRGLADLTVVALLIVIASGAAVRLTGSGLGCDNWPQCSDSSVLPELSTHALIEYGNRIISGLVGIPILALVLLAPKRAPRRDDLVRLSRWLFAGVVAEGAMGGLLVKVELQWASLMAHYVLALALLFVAVMFAWRARRPDDAPAPEHDRRLTLATRALVAYGAFVLVLGTLATAAGPHAGGAGTGDVVERLRLDAFGAETLRQLILLHGHLANALGWLTVLLWFVARRRGASAGLRRALTATALLIAAQGAAGLIQYHSDLPAEVVWFHASGAAALWAALVWSGLEAGRPAPAPARVSEAAAGARPASGRAR